MRCLKMREEARGLFAFPYPFTIWRPPESAVKAALAIAEDFGIGAIYTVGDVVTANFLSYGVRPKAAAVDMKTRRSGRAPRAREFGEVVKVRNPPGYITEEAWDAVRKAVESGDMLIVVEGEEDLLSLAFIALGPDDAAVAYGHYGGALVFIPLKAYRVLAKLLDYMDPC